MITSDVPSNINVSLDSIVTYTTDGDITSTDGTMNYIFVGDGSTIYAIASYPSQGDGVSPDNVTTYYQGDNVFLNISVSPDDSEGYHLTAADDGSAQANMVALSKDTVDYIDFANWDVKFERQDSSKGSAFYFESQAFNNEISETRDVLVTPESLSGDSDYIKAKEKADGYVKGMGIDYMALNSVSRGEGSYCFYYTRMYNGLPETYVQTHTGTTVTGVDGAPIINLWGSEYLYIEIQNGNVVKARWQDPSEIKTADNGKANMLPWDQIKDIFLKQMDSMMASGGSDEGNTYRFMEGAKVHINRVELGYTKLLTNGTNGEYKLVPTWMFMGYQENEANALHKGANNGAETCFVTINALDGTIIDRGQGS